MKCTWKDCDKDGIVNLYDRYNRKWSTLCEIHNNLLNNSIDKKDVKLILKYWILAQSDIGSRWFKKKKQKEYKI